MLPILAPLAAATALAASNASTVEPWTPRGVSSDQFESHAAFDPLTGDLYFVRSKPDFTGWRILITDCREDGWVKPDDPTFSGDGVEADPWFTPDGRRLYFISNRSTDGVKRDDLDLWTVDRGKSLLLWDQPRRLPAPVNSTSNEWFPRLSVDGWLYFGSNRPGGRGKTDIWRARQTRRGAWRVENLGPAVNTAGNEYEALPSPDGRSLIVEGDRGYFEVHKTRSGWSARKRLPPTVNVNGSEIGATFSPSGRTLLFARDTKGPLSGEFFVWHRSGHEAWPPSCPAP